VGWFSRKPTQQKLVGAAIKVASNLYFITTAGAEDAPVALQFTLPDSRYRYLIFCLSAMATACAHEMTNPDAVMNECLHFVIGYATTEGVRDFFGGPEIPHDAANNGAAYLQDFLNKWSIWFELRKKGKSAETIDLICSMIHTAESNLPAVRTDSQRLEGLAQQIDFHFPAMRDAFIELTR
jgi:hypothetical protein